MLRTDVLDHLSHGVLDHGVSEITNGLIHNCVECSLLCRLIAWVIFKCLVGTNKSLVHLKLLQVGGENRFGLTLDNLADNIPDLVSAVKVQTLNESIDLSSPRDNLT